MRRFTEELGMARDTFFADIAHEFPQWDFRANGNKFEKAPASTRDARKREWELIGYAVALSTAQKMKSVAFSRVKTIIFDEFIIEKGLQRYLPDEPKVFNNFYSTVDRWMDKTTVFFLANAVSLMCPYLIEYNLLPTDDTPEFMKVMDGFIVAHFPKAEDFANQALATRFGQFIQGTEYADYAVGNVFADNNADLVDIKPSSADYMCTLETRTGTFSIWWDIDADLYYAQRKRPGNEKFYTLMPEKMTEDKILLLHNDLILGRLRMAFRTAKIMFDTPATRNMFVDVFRRKT